MGDVAVGLHFAEHKVAPAESLVGVKQRRVGDGALRQAGQQGSFGQRQVLGVFGKGELRGGFKALHAAAEINLISVECEDLLLGEGAFNLNGEVGFLQFSSSGALGGEKEVARQLHGQRGRALDAAVAAQIVKHRAGDAQDIDAPVRLEALVFNGNDSLAEDGREVIETDDNAALECERTDNVVVAIVDIGCGGGPIALKILDLGQIDGIDERCPGERSRNDGEQEEEAKRNVAGQFVPSQSRNRLGVKAMVTAHAARFEGLFGTGSQELQASWAPSEHVAKECQK